MNNLERTVLEGEILLLKEELEVVQRFADFFAKEQDFWRSKYLKDHPEHDNWEYVHTARETEGMPGQ